MCKGVEPWGWHGIRPINERVVKDGCLLVVSKKTPEELLKFIGKKPYNYRIAILDGDASLAGLWVNKDDMTHEHILGGIAAIIALAHDRGATCQVIISTAWGCPYEGDVPPDRVVAVASRAVRDGADSASFGDTTGMATPSRVTRLVGEFRMANPETPLNLHFHNTRGTGLANVLAALQLGVADFDASVGGLGGCPYAPGATGNTSAASACRRDY